MLKVVTQEVRAGFHCAQLFDLAGGTYADGTRYDTLIVYGDGKDVKTAKANMLRDLATKVELEKNKLARMTDFLRSNS